MVMPLAVEKRMITGLQGGDKRTVDKQWSADFKDKKVEVNAPQVPLLVYHQPKECTWINATVPRKEENIQRFRLLGSILGMTVVNGVNLDLKLPSLFFKVGLGLSHVMSPG